MNTGWSGKWSGEVRRILFLILIVPAAYGQTRVPEQPANPSGPPAATARAIIDQYCVPCHNQRLKTAGLMLDKLDSTEVRKDAEVWEKVVRKLRAGMMPPSGLPRPTPAIYEALIIDRKRTRPQHRNPPASAGSAQPQSHRIRECDP